MGARDEGKAHAAIEKLEAEGIGAGEVHYFNVDMSNALTAKNAAEAFMKQETRLDILGTPINTLSDLVH